MYCVQHYMLNMFFFCFFCCVVLTCNGCNITCSTCCVCCVVLISIVYNITCSTCCVCCVCCLTCIMCSVTCSTWLSPKLRYSCSLLPKICYKHFLFACIIFSALCCGVSSRAKAVPELTLHIKRQPDPTNKHEKEKNMHQDKQALNREITWETKMNKK
jgi:hypothetical protein